MRKIRNFPILLSPDGKPIQVLKDVQEPEIERNFNEYNVMRFTLQDFQGIRAEQELIYRNERYRITRVSEIRTSEKITEIEGMSAFVELNNMSTIGKIEFTNATIRNGAERILTGTSWEIDVIEDETNDYAYSFKEAEQTVLWCIRQYARICGYEIKFDTINKKISFLHEVGKQTNEIIRYKKNLREIIKIEEPPRATVIYPRGRGGLTIENVNNGLEYVEDYSWYTDVLGFTLAEARQKFRKVYVWEDNRFIYSGTLKREAEKKIHDLSRPVISYETGVAYIGTNNLDVGDYAWIIDSEMNLKLPVRVVRIIDHPHREWENEIEFNYLVPGLGSTQEQSTENDKGETETILVKNEQDTPIGQSYGILLELAVSSFAAENLQAGLYIIGESTEKALLTGYMTFNGVRIGPQIKQVVDGWHTLGLPFVILQIQEGVGYLELFLRIENGTFNISRHDAELFITGTNLLGGLSSKLPRINVVETVDFIPPMYVEDVVDITLIEPISIFGNEHVDFVDIMDVSDNVYFGLINASSVVPMMYGNDDPHPLNVTSKSHKDGYQPYIVFDKSEYTEWLTEDYQENNNEWLQIDLGLNFNEEINSYMVRGSQNTDMSPSEWTVEGSHDGDDWDLIDEQLNVQFDEREFKEFFVDVSNYRFYRWSFNKNNGSDEHIAVSELDLIHL